MKLNIIIFSLLLVSMTSVVFAGGQVQNTNTETHQGTTGQGTTSTGTSSQGTSSESRTGR